MYKALGVCVPVLSGSEEAENGVCARGSWTVHRRGVHHRSDLSLPNGFALGVGPHPRVNATLLINTPLSIFYQITWFVVPSQYRTHRQTHTGIDKM